ncbi:MAG: recombination regulator RecX [Clostridium paraputrificum]
MSKITKIEAQKRTKDRVNIYIDEAYAFSVSAELVYREGLRKDLVINEEKLKEVVKEDNIIKCKNTALRIVERSYKTEKEIKEKLFEKGYEKDEIDKTLEFLSEYKFINDEAYTKMYVKDRAKTQGRGKIKYALMKKGVDQEDIESALETIDKDEEKEAALELARKRYLVISKRESDKYKIWNKLYRFLVGRGYDYSLVKEIVKEVVNVEELE